MTNSAVPHCPRILTPREIGGGWAQARRLYEAGHPVWQIVRMVHETTGLAISQQSLRAKAKRMQWPRPGVRERMPALGLTEAPEQRAEEIAKLAKLTRRCPGCAAPSKGERCSACGTALFHVAG